MSATEPPSTRAKPITKYLLLTSALQPAVPHVYLRYRQPRSRARPTPLSPLTEGSRPHSASFLTSLTWHRCYCLPGVPVDLGFPALTPVLLNRQLPGLSSCLKLLQFPWRRSHGSSFPRLFPFPPTLASRPQSRWACGSGLWALPLDTEDLALLSSASFTVKRLVSGSHCSLWVACLLSPLLSHAFLPVVLQSLR